MNPQIGAGPSHVPQGALKENIIRGGVSRDEGDLGLGLEVDKVMDDLKHGGDPSAPRNQGDMIQVSRIELRGGA